MRWAECGALAGALLFTGFACADSPAYGKVETFQPGKKYNCVPTPDHKAWDCSESGKAAPEQARDTAPVAPPSASNPPAAAAAPKAGALPGYLTNAAAGSRAAKTAAPVPSAEPQPAAAAAAAPESPVESKASTPAVPASAPVAEESPAPIAPAPAPPPSAPVSTPAPAQPPTAVAEPVAKPPPPARTQMPAPRADSEFANLPGEQYVLELAHADSADINAPAVAHGKVYKLHLRQNGVERWLLLWGPFDSVESARAARDEIAAQGATPGWPRRVAPLQAEARNSGD